MIAPEHAGPTRQRLPFIDALRGFALFGVFGANLMIFSGIVFMTGEQRAAVSTTVLDRVVYVLERFLIENKFIGLFSILFGVSFWLFLDRARARGGSGIALFYRRIGWLFLFGALHGWLLWCFDILRFYALWALFLPLLVGMPLRRLLAVALSTAVLAPAVIAGVEGWLAGAGSGDSGAAYDARALAAFSTGGYLEVLSVNWQYDWYLTDSIGQLGYQLSVFGRLLLGLYAARALTLADLNRHRASLTKILLIGAVLGVVGNSVFAGGVFEDAAGIVMPFARTLILQSGFLGLTLAYACSLALLFTSVRWRPAVQLMAPMGQMALTWYLFQTFFGIWLFYGFPPGPHLMGDLGPARIALVWVAGYLFQAALAHLWMQHFRFGPAEWLWRSLTYWRVQPLKVSGRGAGREHRLPRERRT